MSRLVLVNQTAFFLALLTINIKFLTKCVTKSQKIFKKNKKYTVRITSNMTYVVDDSRPRVPKWVQHRIMDRGRP